MTLQIASTAALSVLLLVALQTISAQGRIANKSQAAPNSGPPSITTANAPQDHLSLAEYFGELASQERALAESYGCLAKMYSEKEPAPGIVAATAREMKDQYRRLAETEKKAASAAATAAAYHSRLAGAGGTVLLQYLSTQRRVSPLQESDTASVIKRTMGEGWLSRLQLAKIDSFRCA